MGKTFDDLGSSQLIEYLQNIDARIQKIESRLNISSTSDKESDSQTTNDSPSPLEFNLGEFWFAEIGVFIMAIGCAFLLTLPYKGINPFIPTLVGLCTGGGLIFVSKFWKGSFEQLIKHIWGAAFLLIFISVLRLFHFTESPVISNATVELIVLFGVIVFFFFMLRYKSSPYLVAVTLTLAGSITVILNNTWLIFLATPILAALFVLYYKRNQKTIFILYGMFICYGIHLVWALSNPFHSGSFRLMKEPGYHLIILLLYTFIFSLVYFKKDQFKINTEPFYAITILNVIGGFILFQLLNLVNESSFIYQLILFVGYAGISILAFYKREIHFPTAVYSLLAFAGLSIGIIKSTVLPDVYIYLIWQSLIVAGMAIWFKSKNIIVANFLIFLFIFVAYLSTAGSFEIISLSFGIVALVSARTLNWQKERLTLKTEMMRNVYLGVAFFSIPLTLMKSLPGDYIGLSWLGVTILYYVLSVVLRNNKYQWMAHFTLMATILYSFIIGISGSITLLKIITFISTGIVLLAVSIMFTRLKHKKEEINV